MRYFKLCGRGAVVFASQIREIIVCTGIAVVIGDISDGGQSDLDGQIGLLELMNLLRFPVDPVHWFVCFPII